jgi:hypothetical protein
MGMIAYDKFTRRHAVEPIRYYLRMYTRPERESRETELVGYGRTWEEAFEMAHHSPERARILSLREEGGRR